MHNYNHDLEQIYSLIIFVYEKQDSEYKEQHN